MDVENFTNLHFVEDLNKDLFAHHIRLQIHAAGGTVQAACLEIKSRTSSRAP